MKTEQKLALLKEVLEDMKAEDVVTIDASTRTIMADAFLVVTATSDTHARAMADKMHLALKAAGVKEDHSEVDSGREWTCVDLGDIVVHIFLEKARRYYNIEELWGKVSAARKQAVKGDKAEKPARSATRDKAADKSAEEPRARAGKARKMSPGMERLAEETRAARGKRSSAPTYRTGAKLVRKAPKKRDDR